MRSGVVVALAIGFGSLLVLIGLLGFGANRRAREMYTQMVAAQTAYEETDKAVRDLPADIHLAGILARDFALDPSPVAAPVYKEQLMRVQKQIKDHITRLTTLGTVQKDKVERLQREAQVYADSIDPMLVWSLQERFTRSYGSLRGKRQSIVALAQEISNLNAQNMEIERHAWERSQTELHSFVTNLLWSCLGVGLVVAILTTFYVTRLQSRTHRERVRAEEAEREQRRLAVRVVHAQEEERKRISLELHDAVGQMASALGMELGRLETANQQSPRHFHEAIGEVKRMNTEVVRAIRDLAGGLRPAMLDDLGLGPALRSHAREFSRRTGVPVDVRVEGTIESVPEPHRTCIYRIVQEALNNCGRHAKAKHVILSLYGRPDLVSVTVQDDGVGFDTGKKPRAGLGLVGIQERARDLSGKATITSKPGHGTLLEVELPVRQAVEA